MRAYCDARGWRLAKVYADEGVSSAARRRAFEQMVTDVLADGVDAIVAMKLDRLGRSAAGLLSLYERLEKKGVRIVTDRGRHRHIDRERSADANDPRGARRVGAGRHPRPDAQRSTGRYG